MATLTKNQAEYTAQYSVAKKEHDEKNLTLSTILSDAETLRRKTFELQNLASQLDVIFATPQCLYPS